MLKIGKIGHQMEIVSGQKEEGKMLLILREKTLK